jgi:hypothetical protein
MLKAKTQMENRKINQPKMTREEVWAEMDKATKLFQVIANPTQEQKDAYALAQERYSDDMKASYEESNDAIKVANGEKLRTRDDLIAQGENIEDIKAIQEKDSNDVKAAQENDIYNVKSSQKNDIYNTKASQENDIYNIKASQKKNIYDKASE